MLNSWFTKPPNAKDAGVKLNDHEKDVSLQQAFSGLNNPHDEVVVQLQGASSESPVPDGAQGTYNLPIPQANSTNRITKESDPIYDPYDGSNVGHRDPLPHSNTKGSIEDKPNNEVLWSHLSRLLELQKEIARLHMDMEGVGARAGDVKKDKGKLPMRDKTGPVWPHRKTSVGPSGSVIDNDMDEPVDAEPDEEEVRERTRQQDFAKLADQFEGRKETIQEIMNKLDSLAGVLTDFHALQAPKIEFSNTSRNNSIGVSPETTPVHASAQLSHDIATTASVLPSPSILPASLSRNTGKRPALPLTVNTAEAAGTRGYMFDSPISVTRAGPSAGT